MKKLMKILIIFTLSTGVVYLLWKPICKIFSVAYNFIQTNSLFTSNLFNFILVAAFFVWLLFYFIDIVGILDKKSKETIMTITNAENKKAEAQNHLEETKNSLKNVDKDVENIVANAKETAKNNEEHSSAKLSEELQSIKGRTKFIQDSHRAKAEREVSATVANAAVIISKEYIKNSLDEKTHKELIMNFINDLDEGIKL